MDYRLRRNEGAIDLFPASRAFDVRYAATRADVVAHSMGGLLTKWYIADTNLGGTRVPRPGFPSPRYDITDQRVPFPDPSGRWDYIRPDNWGAGSIRRFITIGTPFNGSPVNSAYAGVALPGPGGPTNPSPHFDFAKTHVFPSKDFKDTAKQIFPPNGVIADVNYVYPTALSDLSPSSRALQTLSASVYPSGHRQVRWFPIVGQAVPNFKSPETLYQEKFGRVTRDTLDRYGLGWDDVFLPNATSDLIVAMNSQRNFSSTTPENAAAGLIIGGVTHSYLKAEIRLNPSVVVPGEADSVLIRDHIINLLSEDAARFDSTWSIK